MTPSTQKDTEIKQQVFIEEYLKCFNASEAARRAGYLKAGARKIGYELIRKEHIAAQIKERLAELHLQADEALKILSDHARGNVVEFFDGDGSFDIDDIKKKSNAHIIKRIKVKRIPNKFGEGAEFEIEAYSAQEAIEKILKIQSVINKPTETKGGAFAIPAENIAPDFLDAYRDIIGHKHTEYMFFGGRGSTKSSFVSLAIIYILLNNPLVHALATRQVAATLRDSVYSQLRWAIGVLGLDDQFRCVTNPLEIEYLPTGQKIYFRGADDPIKIKSIKPSFGYLGVVWFEELSEFRGEEVIRSVTQSAIRGGDEAFIFKSYNPSRTANNWVNKYAQIPKDTQYQHKSSYLSVPIEWLGKTFVDEAEHLKNVNPAAYDHEYLGIVNGTGGQIFQNVTIRKITDAEIFGADDGSGVLIGGFDHVLHGLDWGFYPDPNHYSRVHYDAARLTLYIFGEVRKWKTSNRDMYQAITEYGYDNADLLIADSAEPKSVADMREYGANCRGAEKGKDSVKYSMKWLQSLKEIVIDNERAPYSAAEFLDYEFEQTKDGDFINAYPDKNDHAIASVRYATNLIWRRRGE